MSAQMIFLTHFYPTLALRKHLIRLKVREISKLAA
jgi:hypothetical protein